jgi:hypothetical protein
MFAARRTVDLLSTSLNHDVAVTSTFVEVNEMTNAHRV